MTPSSNFTIALAGNPNVGKSTIFNALTGLHQHTGNWSGKTVACASGLLRAEGSSCLVVDLPGTYSLNPRSEEEKIARDYITSGRANLLLTVCDATCLERGLRLLRQIRALGTLCPEHIVLCVNLCDEAARKGISIDFQLLEQELGIPVIPCSARKRDGLQALRKKIAALWSEWETCSQCLCPCHACCHTSEKEPIRPFSPSSLASRAVENTDPSYLKHQLRIDRIVTGPWTGGLLMLLLLLAVFWLTVTGANYPSAFLWDRLFCLETWMAGALASIHAPDWFISCTVYGIYRVVAWVVSVMLPPMAIFFPLFTLLEDLGYLPRAAFNMDCAFKKCHACGKQCLTMCSGTAFPF